MQWVCCFIRFKKWCFFRILDRTDMDLECSNKIETLVRCLHSDNIYQNIFAKALTFVGDEPLRDCIYVPAPTFAKKRQPAWIRSWPSSWMDNRGRFGQARAPNTTLPLSSNANAIAYWSPLRNLCHDLTNISSNICK